MTNLLYKELRLAAHPNLFIFMLMGALLLVPDYPFGVVFLFGVLGPYITFFYDRETRAAHIHTFCRFASGNICRWQLSRH